MKLAFSMLFFLGFVAAQAAEKLPVASLSTVLTDIARNVGGDRVDVAAIVKPDIDPHEFEPTPGDIKAIGTARVVLASGLGFETYLDKLRSAVGVGPVFVVVGESIKPIMVDVNSIDEDERPAEVTSGNIPDPHWFHSVGNAKVAARVIRDAFVAADPAGREVYEAKTKAYLAKLDELAAWEKLEIAKLPREKRILVTSHDALGYFARDNGFKVLPVEGVSPSDQPSSKKVRELIEEIKGSGVKAIFAENIENPKVLSEITKETGAKLGGTLYADGLGGGEGSTYEGMVRHNVTVVVSALQ